MPDGSRMNQPSFSGNPRFEIVRQLGQGAVGVVYLAMDLEREEQVALKTLSRTDPQALFSLKREFRSLANLHHPNLAKVYDLFAEGTEPFFTLELIRGVDVLARPQARLGRRVGGDSGRRARRYAV